MDELAGTLEVRSLRVHFQGLKAVDGVDLDLRPPEILGLIGPNGAGKTTVINAITGFQEPTDGSVSFEGNDVTGARPEKLARRGISRTFQGVRLFGGLSAIQNVEVAALAAGQRRRAARQIAENRVEEAGLSSRAHLRGDVLTTGEEHLLGVARALASGPKILLLDEPTAGLNDEETNRFIAYLRMIRESENLALMIIEHDMRVIMGLCDRIQVLNYGQTIGVGTPEEIRRNPEVLEAYLGTDGDIAHA